MLFLVKLNQHVKVHAMWQLGINLHLRTFTVTLQFSFLTNLRFSKVSYESWIRTYVTNRVPGDTSLQSKRLVTLKSVSYRKFDVNCYHKHKMLSTPSIFNVPTPDNHGGSSTGMKGAVLVWVGRRGMPWRRRKCLERTFLTGECRIPYTASCERWIQRQSVHIICLSLSHGLCLRHSGLVLTPQLEEQQKHVQVVLSHLSRER